MEQTTQQSTILGCGYVGRRVAQQWTQAGLTVTATTTTPTNVPTLETIAHNAVVIRGDDAPALQHLLAYQDTVLVSVAGRRKGYKETYLNTAQTLAQVLPHTLVRQVIYTSSFSVYGNHGGHWVTEET
ncbi:MAG: NAD(P)H-binding protein, partial [Symploca sp. SIO2B6]|nr:NAD(P)H-binding protein [Symploca sp. SIO2B6]